MASRRRQASLPLAFPGSPSLTEEKRTRTSGGYRNGVSWSSAVRLPVPLVRALDRSGGGRWGLRRPAGRRGLPPLWLGRGAGTGLAEGRDLVGATGRGRQRLEGHRVHPPTVGVPSPASQAWHNPCLAAPDASGPVARSPGLAETGISRAAAAGVPRVMVDAAAFPRAWATWSPGVRVRGGAARPADAGARQEAAAAMPPSPGRLGRNAHSSASVLTADRRLPPLRPSRPGAALPPQAAPARVGLAQAKREVHLNAFTSCSSDMGGCEMAAFCLRLAILGGGGARPRHRVAADRLGELDAA
jgi:hypothetical protein